MRARPRDPGAISSAPIGETRALRSAVPGEEQDGGARPERRSAREPVELGVEDVRLGEGAGPRELLAPREIAELYALEVDRAARPRRGARLGAPEALQAADARAPSAGEKLHRVAHPKGRAEQRPGHDGTEAAHLEAAVDEEARRPAARGARPGGNRKLAERRAERRKAGAGGRRDGQHGRAGEARRREEPAHLLGGELRHLGVREIGLGQGDDPVADAEQVADRDVLPGLGHHAFVGGHDQQHEIDAGGAGDHGAHEGFVARHVDHAEAAARAELEGREAELDGDAPRLLLGETVGVDSRQRAHQRGLAVVDVARGAEDQGLGAHRGGRSSPRPT